MLKSLENGEENEGSHVSHMTNIVAVLHLPHRMDVSILWNVLELG